MPTACQKIVSIVAISLFLLIPGCASSKIVSSWKDPEYKVGQIKKIVVIGVFKRASLRRFFEEEFVRRLKMKNIEAVPGYSVIKDEKMKEDVLIDKIHELDIDAILISRVVDRKTLETYYPPQTAYIGPRPYYHDWYHYYRDSYDYVITPGYKVEQEIIRIETSIYDTRSQNLVWSALSESYTDSPSLNEVESFIADLMNRMQSQGMLPE